MSSETPKTITVQITRPQDHDIVETIKKNGGNLSEVIRQLLRQHRNNKYQFEDQV